MKYKLSNLAASVAIVSSLLPLTGCQSNDHVTYKTENELSYLVNPFYWNRVPETACFDVDGYHFAMDIDSFYRLINQDEDIVTLQTEDGEIKANRLLLKAQADQEFGDFQNRPFPMYLKGAITTLEVIGACKLIKKGKEKIKKLS